VQHPFAAVAPTGRPDAQRPPGQTGAAESGPAAGVDGAAGLGRWERGTLVATDFTTLAALSAVAGSTVPATAVRTALCLVLFAAVGQYRPRLRFSPLDDLSRALLCMIAVLPLGVWWQLPTLLAPPWFNAAPFLWPVAMFTGFFIARAITCKAIHGTRRRVAGAATVVVGTGPIGLRIAEVLTDDPAFGLRPVGVVGPAPLMGEVTPVSRLGCAGDLDAVLARTRPDVVVVTFPGPPDADLVGTLRACRRLGITVFVVPRLFELAVTGAELVHGVPLVRMPAGRSSLGRLAKRVVDVFGAGVGLLLLSPVLLLCALLVRLESRAARVIFRQERIGQHDRPFTIMKFRSLTPSSDRESQVRWNINNDARVGRIGRLLRTSSLDELPQLLNVLRGDMSLVGPRPERPYFVEQFRRTHAGYADRHRMPVGITGWAQIHGLRGDTSIEERVRFDNYYIENWSLGLDLKIIARTVGSMLSINRK
jgi:exopolysaccharide biosynthesis polyprenyl glycosylphosphotransferase